MRRILIVTLALAATGAAFGSGLGALSLWLAGSVLGLGPNLGSARLLIEGAKAGALAGTVLGPVSAWSMMRFVPLWRAIGEPALGTALGAIAGAVAASAMKGSLAWSIIGALIGFVVAAVRLRIAFGAKSTRKDSVAPADRTPTR